jgi:ribosomal protein L11 methyltransferase
MGQTRPKSRRWVCIEVIPPLSDFDRYVQLFWELGTTGLEETQGEPLILKAYFPGEGDQEDVRSRFREETLLMGLNPDAKIYYSFSNPEDWVENYKKNFHGFSVGKTFYVHPSWENTSPHHPVNLMIDPGHAFGTGTHESTQLCLLALESVLPCAESLLDIGTGSGILALAARKMSRDLPIAAFDSDFQAVEMALENAQRNQARPLMLFAGVPASVKRRFDLVIANLTLGIFEQTSSEIIRLVGRYLVVSGFTVDQVHLVAEIFGESLQKHQSWEANGWACLSFVRPGHSA